MFLRLLRKLWNLIMGVNEQTLNTPKYSNDKIIGVLTGSVAVDTDFDGILSYKLPTGIDDTTLLEGVYTFESDPQYQNLNTVYYINDDRALPINASMYSTKGNVVLDVEGARDGKVNYRIFLLAKKDQGEIRTLNIDYDAYLTSKTNYRKIFEDEIVTITTASGGTVSSPKVQELVVPHNLNYYPTVRRFVDNNYRISDADLAYNAEVNTNVQTVVGTKDVTFRFLTYNSEAETFKLHYRIYYDEH